MIRKLFQILLIFSLISCYHENKEAVKIPVNKLSKDQMIDILTDLQLAEGIITYRRIDKLPAKEYGEAVYTKVIEEHHISREQLQENIDFYNDDPKLMEKIYDEVLARLNKMQTEIMLEAAKLDSIARINSDSLQILDSTNRFEYINFVLSLSNDSASSNADSSYNWEYKKWIKLPGIIY